MIDWNDELRAALADVQYGDAWRPPAQSGRSRPGADASARRQIRLRAWAVEVAERLHQRYGEALEIEVGVMSYPDRRFARGDPRSGLRQRRAATPLIDQDEISVALSESLSLRSGHSTGAFDVRPDHAAVFGLQLHNLTARPVRFVAGPWLVGTVIDPATGEPVGGCSGVMPLIRAGFSVPPGGSTRYALIVCTDSFDPDLGYVVLPGEWGVETILNRLADGGHGPGRPYRTPILPLTVVP